MENKICPIISNSISVSHDGCPDFRIGTEHLINCQHTACMAWCDKYPSGAPHLEGGYCKLIGDTYE